MPLDAALVSIDIAVGSEKDASIVVPERPPLLRVSPLAMFALESPSATVVAAAADNAVILSFSSPVDILAEVENEEEDDEEEEEEEEEKEGREGSVPIHPFPPPLLLGT